MPDQSKLSFPDDHSTMDSLEVLVLIEHWSTRNSNYVIPESFMQFFNAIDVLDKIAAKLGVSEGILEKLRDDKVHGILTTVFFIKCFIGFLLRIHV